MGSATSKVRLAFLSMVCKVSLAWCDHFIQPHLGLQTTERLGLGRHSAQVQGHSNFGGESDIDCGGLSLWQMHLRTMSLFCLGPRVASSLY